MKKTRIAAALATARTHVAALTVELSAGQKLAKIFPAGEFRARDGRPAECASWVMTAGLGLDLVAAADARQTPYVVDYEHQTLRAADNGKPAPASGWFKRLVWQDDGLYAEIEWTAAAAAMIEAREYLYLSPVFAYDKQGRITALLHVALTNNPALDELPALSVAALSAWASALSVQTTTATQESTMDIEAILENLRWMLNLPLTVTVEEVQTHLQKLIDMLSDGKGIAAASVDVIQLLSDQKASIAALSTNQVDLTKFVPISTMTALQAQVAELTAKVGGREVNDLVIAALSDGRLLPAQEAWARELGKTNVAALSAFLATAPKIAALTTTQTAGLPTPTAPAPQGDADHLAICAAFGNDPSTVMTSGA